MTSTSYPVDSTDWKGLFIQRMVEGLSGNPDIQLEFWGPQGPMPSNVGSALLSNDGAWFKTLASEGGIAHLLRKRPVLGLFKSLALLIRERRALATSSSELLHINWIQNALALPEDSRPVLITALGTDIQLLKLPLVRSLLRRKFKGRRVTICPNAEWMVPQLESLFGDLAKIVCIPFGIDKRWYEIERAQTNAPHRWLCVSRVTSGKLGPLFRWAEPYFKDGRRELHLIGPKQDADIVIPSWVKYHGSAAPTDLQSKWFPEVTGLISLSAHPEGRPQVMLEAMASGVPILASRLPAHEDLIENNVSGRICDDIESFAQGLEAFENPEQNKAIGHSTRQQAINRFGNWDDCADRFWRVYQ